MARLYTNENFPQPAVARLRELGHDVLTTHDAGNSNSEVSDPEVLRFAVAQERAVVTLNRRDFIRLHRRMPDHAGILVCTANADFIDLAARVDGAIRAAGPLAGQLLRVNRGGGITEQASGLVAIHDVH